MDWTSYFLGASIGAYLITTIYSIFGRWLCAALSRAERIRQAVLSDVVLAVVMLAAAVNLLAKGHPGISLGFFGAMVVPLFMACVSLGNLPRTAEAQVDLGIPWRVPSPPSDIRDN